MAEGKSSAEQPVQVDLPALNQKQALVYTHAYAFPRTGLGCYGTSNCKMLLHTRSSSKDCILNLWAVLMQATITFILAAWNQVKCTSAACRGPLWT